MCSDRSAATVSDDQTSNRQVTSPCLSIPPANESESNDGLITALLASAPVFIGYDAECVYIQRASMHIGICLFFGIVGIAMFKNPLGGCAEGGRGG